MLVVMQQDMKQRYLFDITDHIRSLTTLNIDVFVEIRPDSLSFRWLYFEHSLALSWNAFSTG